MKKLLVCLIITTLFLFIGCSTIYNLTNFTVPDDEEFLVIVESLDTPEKICDYMKENFTFKPHYIYTPDPYTFWKLREGDCNDFVAFAQFVANFHGYETYQMLIYFKGTILGHALGVFVEDGKYTYSNNKAYYPIYVGTFKEVVSHYFETCFEYEYKAYKVYDYDNNLVEEGK